jgi:two-component system KDP operon response regulator KdpE
VAARVLVITAELRLLRVLPVALSNDGYQPETAPTGKDGLVAAASMPPTAVILDCELPDLTGVDVVRGLRRWSRAPLVALSGDAGTPKIVDALDAGADDCVRKPVELLELLARLRAVRRRTGTETGVPLVSVGRHVVDLARHCVLGPHGKVALTPVEWEVLETLLRHAGKLVSQEQLLTEVGGDGYLREGNSLRVLISRLRCKLEDDPAQPRHLITEPGRGYWFSTRPAT